MSQGTHRSFSNDKYLSRYRLAFATLFVPDNNIFAAAPTNDAPLFHNFGKTYLDYSFVSSPKVDDEYYGTLGGIIKAAEEITSDCGHPPVARFEYKSRAYAVDPIAPEPMIYDFDGSISTDEDMPNPNDPSPIQPPDFDIVNFEWLIEDTTIEGEAITVHLTGMKPVPYTFKTEGVHQVQLIVTDAEGNKSDPEIKFINVVDLNPTPGFTTTVDGLKVNFNATTSTDDGKIVDYAWNFGDGFLGNGLVAEHTYLFPGTYPVTLTVTDNNEKTSVMMQNVTITSSAFFADFHFTF